MGGKRGREPLTGQDWLWIVLLGVIASVATVGSFLYFLPAYALALSLGYWATQIFHDFFAREPRWQFVLKVLAVVLPLFGALFASELWLMGVYVRSH